MLKNTLFLSVREIIESIFLSGDLNLSSIGVNRLLQGAEGHKYIQGKRKEKWQNEFYIKHSLRKFEVDITVQGRIDSILISEDISILEEIKTYINKPSFNILKLNDFIDEKFWVANFDILNKYQSKFQGISFTHWAQILIYSYMFLSNQKKHTNQCLYNNLEKKCQHQSTIQKDILCRVNYVKIPKCLETIFEVICSFTFLECFFTYCIDKWLSQHLEYNDLKQLKINSLKSIQFPFDFRNEQRKMAIEVYKSINNGVNLYSRAPTGTGKTLATLFPALKAMGERKTEKIFYLTSKTVGQAIAEFAIQLLQCKGADIRYSVMTAKEKTCLKGFPLCDPEFCEFTHDYYQKQKVAISEAMKFNIWDHEKITELAKKYRLCPFELSLSLTTHAEIVILDYNYVFDPIVLIRRLFDGLPHSYTFLIDEAHNMPERAREMYSKEIESLELQKWIREFPNKKLKIHKLLLELNEILIKLTPIDKEFFTLEKFPVKIISTLEKINELIIKQLEKKNKPYVKYYAIKIYFQILFVLNSIKTTTQSHIVYFQRKVNQLSTIGNKDSSKIELQSQFSTDIEKKNYYIIKIFCLNPKEIFSEYLKQAKSAIFFSATLHPFDYYCDLLAEKENDRRLSLTSPFEKKKLGLYIFTGINTLYKYRDNSYQPIAELINEICSIRKGNYLIFFPSFSFMNGVYKSSEQYLKQANYIIQQSHMSEQERRDFLNIFDNDQEEKTNTSKQTHFIAFAVMGGIFGEGIDLIGNKLIGAIIISVGLPSICGEKELIKNYYENRKHKGFEYAYKNPGFNKVMQAAGRVIRHEEDKGIVVLIDQRFANLEYRALFPLDWDHNKTFSKKVDLRNEIETFWMIKK